MTSINLSNLLSHGRELKDSFDRLGADIAVRDDALLFTIEVWLRECVEYGRFLPDPSPDRRALQARVDFWTTLLARSGHSLPEIDRIADFDPVAGSPLEVPFPYPGLTAYSEEHHILFCGREEEAVNSVHHLDMNIGLLLVSESGGGKSSLAMAGILPKLKEAHPDWLFVPRMTPGSQPIDALVAALRIVLPTLPDDALPTINDTDEEIAGYRTSAGVVANLLGRRCLLIFLDQLEELLTLCSNTQQQRAFSVMLSALAEGGACRVLATMRSDYLHQLMNSPTCRPLFTLLATNEGVKTLVPLNFDQIRGAILKPADAAGLRFVPPTIVDKLAQQTANLVGGLPLLQFALWRLWASRPTEHGKHLDLINEQQLASLPSVLEALGTAAETQYHQLAPASQVLCRRLMLELTIPAENYEDPIRRRRRESEVIQVLLLYGQADVSDQEKLNEEQILELIDSFVDARLLVRSGEGENRQIEVAHESIFRNWPRFRDWVSGEETKARLQAIRQIQREAAVWINQDRSEDYLKLKGEPLVRAQRYVAEGWLDSASAIYVEQCDQQETHRQEAEESQRQAEERARLAEQEKVLQRERAEYEAKSARKFRRISVVLVVLSIICGVAVGMFWLEKDKAEDASMLATVRERLADAVKSLDVDPEQSLLLGIESFSSARQMKNEELVIETAASLSRALATYPLRLNFPASNSRTYILGYAPKRGFLATFGEDGTAKLWDAKSGDGPRTLEGKTDVIYSASFSPNENLLAAADGKAAYIWEVDSGRLKHQLSGTNAVDVAFSPKEESQVAIGAVDEDGYSTVQLSDATSGKFLRKFPLGENSYKNSITKIAFSPSGRTVATAHYWGDVMLLDVTTGVVRKLGKEDEEAHKATANWVAFSPNGKHLATASGDKTAKIWDAETGNLEHTLTGHFDKVSFLAFSPDGKRLVTSSQDYDARLWDVHTGQLVHVLTGHLNSVFKAIFSPSGKLIASASADDSVRIWNAETGDFMFRFTGHTGPVGDLAFSDDEKTLLSTSWDGTAKAWALDNRHVGPVNQVLFSESGQLATAGKDGTVKLWDPVSGTVQHTLSGHRGAIQALAFTPDGKQLATASWDRTIKISDTVTGREMIPLTNYTDSVYDVAYNPKDGKQLATASLDGSVILWEAGTPYKSTNLGKLEWQALSLAYSPDGTRLAAAGTNGDAFIWDVTSKSEICQLSDPKLDGAWADRAHHGQINKIRFSPQGDYVVTASEDMTAKIWRTSDCSLHKFLTGHTNILFDARFNPADGRAVVTASFDKTAKVWDVLSGQELATLPGHLGPLSAVTFNRAGTRIATAGWDGTTKVWEASQSGGSAQDSFKEIFTITSGGQVNSVDFSPDGSRIAIGSSAGEVVIFPFNQEELIALAKKRVTRPLRPDECKTYLHQDTCPAD